MAELICRACHHPVIQGDLICPGCRANLTANDAVTDSADLAADDGAAADGGPAEDNPAHGGPADDGPADGEPACAEPAHGGTESGGAPAVACPSCGMDLPTADSPVCPGCLTPLAGGLLLELDVATPHGGRWRQVILPGAELVLGRDPHHSPAARILDRYDTVSRRHARVTVDRERQATVTDLGSLNGTFVDDTAVRPGAVVDLRPGSRLRLGRSVSFLVRRV